MNVTDPKWGAAKDVAPQILEAVREIRSGAYGRGIRILGALAGDMETFILGDMIEGIDGLLVDGPGVPEPMGIFTVPAKLAPPPKRLGLDTAASNRSDEELRSYHAFGMMGAEVMVWSEPDAAGPFCRFPKEPIR